MRQGVLVSLEIPGQPVGIQIDAAYLVQTAEARANIYTYTAKPEIHTQILG